MPQKPGYGTHVGAQLQSAGDKAVAQAVKGDPGVQTHVCLYLIKPPLECPGVVGSAAGGCDQRTLWVVLSLGIQIAYQGCFQFCMNGDIPP